MSIPKKTGFGSRRRTTEVIPSLVLGGHRIPTLLSFTFSNSATQYGTVCEIAVLNKDGEVIPGVHALDAWLTSLSTGLDVIATGPAISTGILANGGVVLGSLTASKAFRLATLATGKVSIELIDDITPVLLYVAASIPGIGKTQVSRKTVAGDYKP
jgi:hypothetical protein